MKSSTRKTLKAIAALLSVVVISVIFIDFKIPTALTVPEGEKIDISIPIFGGLVDIESSECSFERTGNRITLATSKTGEYNIGVSFLGVPLKKTTLNVIKGDKVIPGGNVVGIKIHFDGVLVVGIAEFYDGVLWITVPTGILLKGRALPTSGAASGPLTTVAPTCKPLGAII